MFLSMPKKVEAENRQLEKPCAGTIGALKLLRMAEKRIFLWKNQKKHQYDLKTAKVDVI